MSEKDFSKDESIPRVPDENVEEQESSSSANDQRKVEVQRGGESAGSDLGQESPLEGAVGGEREKDDTKITTSIDKKLIKAGKEDLFERFFSKEYTQVKAPILSRHRHKAERQRRRHFSDGSVISISNSNPLQPLHLGEIPTNVVLNQAGAIIGTVAGEADPFGRENGQTLSGFGEDSEHSIGSAETALIGDVYAGNFSSRASDSSRGLSPGSLPSFSPRPPATSDDLKVSPPLDSELPSEDKRMSPTSADSESSAQEKPARQRRSGVTQPFLTSPSPDATEDLQEGVLLTDMSIFSELLRERKISKDSSNDSYDQMSLGDEAIHYAHSVESDSCLPMPDLDPATIEGCETLQIAAGTETDPDEVDQTVDPETTTERSPCSNGSPDAKA